MGFGLSSLFITSLITIPYYPLLLPQTLEIPGPHGQRHHTTNHTLPTHRSHLMNIHKATSDRDKTTMHGVLDQSESSYMKVQNNPFTCLHTNSKNRVLNLN